MTVRAAAVLSWLSTLGFGVPGAYGAWYFADRGVVWTFLGFPTYGDGPVRQGRQVTFWIGFALPLGPVLGVARTALVVAGWSSLGAAASVAESPANR